RIGVAVGLVEQLRHGREVKLRQHEELGVRHGGLDGGAPLGEKVQGCVGVARDRRRLHSGDRECPHPGLRRSRVWWLVGLELNPVVPPAYSRSAASKLIQSGQPFSSAAAAAARPVRTAPSIYPQTHWSEPQT